MTVRQMDNTTKLIEQTGEAELSVAGIDTYTNEMTQNVHGLLLAAEQAGVDMNFVLITVVGGKAHLQVLPGRNQR